MASPLSNFINAFRPAPTPVEKAIHNPMALGTATITETSLKDSIGQTHDYDFSILYGLYKYNTDISGSVHKWAGGITSPGWDLRLMDDEATATNKQIKQMKEMTVWLKRPNPNKGMSSLLYTVVQHLAINGDAFWYVSRDAKGMPLEIWPMHPALTRIVSTGEGEVLGYIMRGPDGTKVVFKPEEVIHFQLPNPSSDVYGEGRVELAVEEAGIDLQALRSNKSLFINGMSPSALLILDDKADPEDARKLTEMIRQNHSGADNRHKILAVSRVQDFKPYSMTPKEMDFLGLRNLATEKVTTVMGVPKVLLGNHNSGDYATTKFLVREMHQNVFMPVQNIIGEAVTEHLIHSINPDFEWFLHKPDASDPDDLRKDQMTAKDKGILTADEVRRDSFTKDPLTKKQKAEAKPAAPVIVDPNAQAKPADTTNAPQEVNTNDGNKDTAPKDLKNDNATKSLTTVHKAMSQDELERLAAAREMELDALADTLVPAVGQYFTGQEDDYLNRLDAELTAPKLNGFITAAAAIQDTQLHMLLFGLLVGSLNAGSQAAQLQINISLGFNQTNPFVQDYLQTQALQHAQGINQTTRDAIKAQLSEGLKAGEGVPELSKRIQSVFTDAKGYRATLIARSETAQAYQYANHASMAASGVVEYRQWNTSERENVCPVCAPLNGYTIRFDAKYPDGVEPTTIHPQCACTDVAVTKEDYDQFNQRNG